MTRPALCLIAMAASAASLTSAVQQPVFSARTSVIRVDVSVTERGRPVLNLQPSDFDVRDNGVRQEVDVLLFEKLPLSLALALDLSGSIAGERLEHLRKAMDAVVDGLRREDRAALVTFSHAVALGTGPTVDRDRLRAALASAKGAGGTALVDATYTALLLGEGDDSRGVLIVFSDGLDTASWLLPSAVLDAAKRSQVVAYAVSTGERPRAAFLRDLTGLTGGSHWEIESTTDLGKAFAAILEEFRHRYLVGYRPRGVAADGWHRIEVRVNRPHASVKARTGYLARER